MERKIVTAIILFFLAVLIAPYISGMLHTPPNTVFLGTVHYPIDYFYYLSNIVQGQERLLTTVYLHSSEPMPALFMGWIYVLLGRLGTIIHVSPFLTYQGGILLFGFLYLIGSYLLLRKIFPTSLPKRIIAFILFMFSDTFPRVVTENGVTFIAPYFSWYNFGEPFVRFSSVPHHTLIQASLFIFLVAFLTYHETKHKLAKLVSLFLIAGTAVVLGSSQPAQWAVITISLVPIISMQFIDSIRKHVTKQRRKTIIANLFPYLLFVVIGGMFILYLRKVFSIEPFISTNIWEAQQSPNLPLDQFVQYHGPVFIISLLGIPWFLKTANTSRRLVLWISVVSLVIFFLPLTKKFPILTFRFLSAVPILLYAAMATEGIDRWSQKAKRCKPLLQSIGVCLLVGLIIPVFHFHLNAKMSFDTNNIYNYLPKDAYNTFLKARELSTPEDTFLVFWPFEAVFPAISGRREYFSNKFATIDFDRKTAEAIAFIGNKMTPETMEQFLMKNKITFVITYNDAFTVPTPFLTPIYTNAYLTIHKVHTPVIQNEL